MTTKLSNGFIQLGQMQLGSSTNRPAQIEEHGPKASSSTHPPVVDSGPPGSGNDEAYLPSSALNDLDKQMHELRGALSDLNAEKDMLGHLLHNELSRLKESAPETQQKASDNQDQKHDEDFENVLVVEEECIRSVNVLYGEHFLD